MAENQKKAAPSAERRQHRLFKKKRAGVVLTEDQVQEIKAGRKKLRRDLRAKGIKSKQEFELMAGSLGLYFDKRSGFLLWFFHGRGLWALLGALLLLLGAFFLMSLVTRMRGFFTINLSDGMFKEGFVLSSTVGFEKPTTELFCEPATDVPCVSFAHLAEDVDQIDGQHNSDYFAYTFYCRNEGESTVDYTWALELTEESKNLSDAAWVMIFEDGEMRFYAKANGRSGAAEALPAFGDDSRGYVDPPLMGQAAEKTQYQLIREKNGVAYYRLVPKPFAGEDLVTEGSQQTVAPGEVHKYTVVIWLEGDDPDATNERIGGHLGLAMQFRLTEESVERKHSWWEDLRWGK